MPWTAVMPWYMLKTMNKQQAGNARRLREAMAEWTARKPEILRLYVNGPMSQAQLAAHFGVSQQGVAKALQRMGIGPKSRGRAGAQNGRFKDGTESTLYRKLVKKDRCLRCEATENLCVHHKDENHLNNDPANLEVLCMSCHSSMHKQAWWDARSSAS